MGNFNTTLLISNTDTVQDNQIKMASASRPGTEKKCFDFSFSTNRLVVLSLKHKTSAPPFFLSFTRTRHGVLPVMICTKLKKKTPKKPYPNPVLTALALNTEAQSIDSLLIIIVTLPRWDSFPECETEMCLSDLLILTGTTNSQIKCFNLPLLQCLTVFYGST